MLKAAYIVYYIVIVEGSNYANIYLGWGVCNKEKASLLLTVLLLPSVVLLLLATPRNPRSESLGCFFMLVGAQNRGSLTTIGLWASWPRFKSIWLGLWGSGLHLAGRWNDMKWRQQR